MMSGPRILVAPSILAADFSQLASESHKILQAGADWLHLDVMDGQFVPNISFGFPVISALRKSLGPEIFFDTHIMVSDPVKWISALKVCGATNVTFHVESFNMPGLNEAVSAIDGAITEFVSVGLQVSLAFKPATSIEPYLPLLKRRMADLFMILIMTVEPGFGGQKFMDECLEKVQVLRGNGWKKYVQVDGGINEETARRAIEAGADVLVAGTAVFNASNVRQAIEVLRGAPAV
jgi:ribulose-phosphate 3-epimerase